MEMRFKRFSAIIFAAVLLLTASIQSVWAVDVVGVNPGDQLTLTAGEALSTGDVVYIKAADGKFWKADTDLAIPAWGIVSEGSGGSVAAAGLCTAAKRGKIIGDSGLTINGDVYLTATAGSYDQTGVAAYKQRLGVAVTATEIVFDIGGASGNIIAGTLSTTGAASLGSTLDVTGATGIDGNFDVGTNKMTVAAATGNTVIAGTLGVTGAVTNSSTTEMTGNVTVNTNKMTVAAATGNTVIAGTLGVTGAITGSADVAGTTGTFSDDITIATTKALNIGTQQVIAEDNVEGVNARRVARALFTYSDQATSGAHDTGVTIPDNAVITGFGYDVTTTFGGDGDDTSTIAIHVESANDMVAAVAIKTGTPWDAGLHEGVPQPDDPSTWVKTTSAQNITVTVAIAATDTLLDAGAMVIWVEYIVTQ